MNNQFQSGKRVRSGLEINQKQEEIIQIYADRIGEKIGRMVSEIIVDSVTMLRIEKQVDQSIDRRAQTMIYDTSHLHEQSASNRLLNGSEIAKRLGISKGKASSLMQRGDIPTMRMGRAVRVRPQDLEEYIKRNYRE
jgi:excisionase family DNA binding protein